MKRMKKYSRMLGILTGMVLLSGCGGAKNQDATTAAMTIQASTEAVTEVTTTAKETEVMTEAPTTTEAETKNEPVTVADAVMEEYMLGGEYLEFDTFASMSGASQVTIYKDQDGLVNYISFRGSRSPYYIVVPVVTGTQMDSYGAFLSRMDPGSDQWTYEMSLAGYDPKDDRTTLCVFNIDESEGTLDYGEFPSWVLEQIPEMIAAVDSAAEGEVPEGFVPVNP